MNKVFDQNESAFFLPYDSTPDMLEQWPQSSPNELSPPSRSEFLDLPAELRVRLAHPALVQKVSLMRRRRWIPLFVLTLHGFGSFAVGG